jgi:hypothetical protein
MSSILALPTSYIRIWNKMEGSKHIAVCTNPIMNNDNNMKNGVFWVVTPWNPQILR